MTQKEINRVQRNDRKLNGNKCTKKYEKTRTGFLMRMYCNMKGRITGVQKAKWHLYKGKYLLPKREFYKFALNNKDFQQLYVTYRESRYQRRLAPSINRIDSHDGYRIKNMEFITMSENSRLGNLNRRK